MSNGRREMDRVIIGEPMREKRTDKETCMV